jgi:rfaE bifunctional protein nucleotidyltransferase chain/domain
VPFRSWSIRSSRIFSAYRGCDAITPNRKEAEAATGISLTGESAVTEAANRLREACGAAHVLITLGERGLALSGPDGSLEMFPALAREVFDVTGAGDTVLAYFGLALAAGALPGEAARLANLAAGVAVGKLGTSAVTPGEILATADGETFGRRKVAALGEAVARVEHERSLGRRIVFTNGCFDLLHAGHVQLLERARAFGDLLVVGVNSDGSVRRLKGAERPVVEERDRLAVLAALDAVSLVVVFDADDPLELIRALRPDVLVKGGDYTVATIVGADEVLAAGGRVETIPLMRGRSTSRARGFDPETIQRLGRRRAEAPADPGFEKRAIRNDGARDDVEDAVVPDRVGSPQAGATVRDARHGPYVHSQIARHDRFRHDAHRDQIRPEHAQHADFGRSLVAGAGQGGQHAAPEAATELARGVLPCPDPGRLVGILEIEKRRLAILRCQAAHGIVSEKVDVVGHDGEVPRPIRLAQPSRRARLDQPSGARQGQNPNGKRRLPGRVPLVGVETAEEKPGAPAGDVGGSDTAAMSASVVPGPSRDVGPPYGIANTERGSQRCESRPEHDPGCGHAQPAHQARGRGCGHRVALNRVRHLNSFKMTSRNSCLPSSSGMSDTTARP